MAGYAKVVGILCIALSGLALLEAVYRFASVDWSAANDDSFGELGASVAVLIISAEVAVALILSAVGAGTYLAGEAAERRASEDEWRRRQMRPAPSQAYGASTRT